MIYLLYKKSTLAFRTLLLCSLALAVGCSKEAPQAVEKVEGSPTPAPRPTIASKKVPQVVEKVEAVEQNSTPRAPVTEDDFKIFDVVLLDLLDFEDFKTASPTKIVLDPMTAGDDKLIGQGWLNGEINSYLDYKGYKEEAGLDELGDDLRRRNPKKLISLAGYKSPSPKILMENLLAPYPVAKDPEDAAIDYRFRIADLPNATRYVIAWLPGYSKDGNTAVFRAFFGPTMHGATLTYKLAKKDGKWTVVWRYVNHHK
jgi:hypothetical protein